MGKGSSGGTSSNTTQVTLPDYAEPYYRDLMSRVGYASSIPYETYQGSRLQYFTPAEQEAMSRFNQLGVSGTPAELQAAGSVSAQVAGGNPYASEMLDATRRVQATPDYQSQFTQGGVSSGYDPYGINQTYLAGQREVGYEPGSLADTGSISQYMNPYQQLVVDRQAEEARRQSQIMGNDIGLQAAGSGSLGGYREAIMQSERQRNLERQLGDIQATGSQQAYSQAQAAFEADRAAQAQKESFGQAQFTANEANRQSQMDANLAAYSANQQAQQQAAQLGLSATEIEQAGRIAEENARRSAQEMNFGQAVTGANLAQSAYSQLLGGDQQRLAAAGQLGDFAQMQQNMEMERLRAMQASGQIERELLQRGLDTGYADFLRQQSFPQEMLSFYNSMLQGVPVQPGSVQQSYGMGPSAAQQILGTGIAGVGLYNAMGN